MRSLINIIGILLIVFGIFTFGYQKISYTKQNKVAEVGNVQLIADTQKTLQVSPMTSGISVVAGVVLMLLARRMRS